MTNQLFGCSNCGEEVKVSLLTFCPVTSNAPVGVVLPFHTSTQIETALKII